MPCWYYDKRELRHTPSIKAGLTLELETQYRREGARFILLVGNKMGLRYETMATGVVFFHRFYMVHSFQEFPRHVRKVEETPKKCRDIMKTAKNLMKDDTWAEFGADPREEVMTLERIILQTIKFDFIVEHPYTYLLKYAKCIEGDKKKLQDMVQMAWTFVNDSLCTTLCLQWEAEIIAIALMYLAGKLSKFEVTDWVGRNPRHTRWWDMFTHGITTDLLEDICHQVLDLYAPNKSEAGRDGKRSRASAAVAKRAAAAGAGAAKQATVESVPQTPLQGTAAATAAVSSTPAAAETSASNNSLATPAATPTLPVPVIGASVAPIHAKDDVDSSNVDVPPPPVVTPAGTPSSSSYGQYGAPYPYSNFNPSYPPPSTTTPRYSYPAYTPSAPPPPQSAPSTPLAPPPTHYPPPINPSSQTPHFSPYTTPIRTLPPYSGHPAAPSYSAPPPTSALPPHYSQTPPSAPYYPPANTNTSYLSGPSPYTSRHYPSGS
ncbi:hypothetical protein HAZT_HAZT007419 [Hyalella azteca]|uniref:Cyclin N-terminal domain-containing protein n=1 Tax=Hyalella azteca TaxID=294128 RepID=A0A6A0HD13_HYAAZ|nr:hypothetical protein HAZT_HAZT007419 [Hyalella azteca]